MNPAEYARMHALEDWYWWFVARRTAAADGHPSSGRYTFDVMTVSPPAMVAPPTAAPAQTPVSNPVLAPERVVTFSTAMRWAELVAVITTVGAVIFCLVVLPASQ